MNTTILKWRASTQFWILSPKIVLWHQLISKMHIIVLIFSENFQQYWKFEFLDKLYKFLCFPNGLSPCPRKFTKITKVPLSDLRLRKIAISGYIDDLFTKDHSSEGCFNNIMSIAELFDRLGFIVHPDKSVLVKSQKLLY